MEPNPSPPSARGKWMALTAALLGWMFDGFEMGLFPLVARPALLDLGVPQETVGTWLSWIIAVFLLGAAAGGVLFGWLGDRIGRVRAMVWSVLAYAIFSGLCGLARSPAEVAGLRFLASLGMGGEWSLGVALVMEVWPSATRPVLAGLIGAAANVGYLLIGFIALGLAGVVHELGDGLQRLGLSQDWVDYLLGKNHSGWRILMLLGALPALLTFLIRIFVPESEKWKNASAHAPAARVRDIFTPRLLRGTLLGTLLAGIALLGTWGSTQWLPSWADKIAPPEAKSTARAWTQIASSFGAVVGTIAAAYLASWTSRRLSYFALAFASFFLCAWFFGNPLLKPLLPAPPTSYGWPFLGVVGIVGCFTASFYGWLPLYLPELFPTRVRATGQGFAFNMGRVIAAGGTLVSGQILNALHENYPEMCWRVTLVYLLGLGAIWLCPETKGKPLPD